MTATVPVFDWLLDGKSIGCGSRFELEHWQGEGVFGNEVTLGKVLCHEPASEDARRAVAWARIAA